MNSVLVSLLVALVGPSDVRSSDSLGVGCASPAKLLSEVRRLLASRKSIGSYGLELYVTPTPAAQIRPVTSTAACRRALGRWRALQDTVGGDIDTMVRVARVVETPTRYFVKAGVELQDSSGPPLFVFSKDGKLLAIYGEGS